MSNLHHNNRIEILWLSVITINLLASLVVSKGKDKRIESILIISGKIHGEYIITMAVFILDLRMTYPRSSFVPYHSFFVFQKPLPFWSTSRLSWMLCERS